MSLDHVYEAGDLYKRFDGTVALDHVTAAVPRHSLVGLIGRNGSGKTTLLRHLLGLYLPSAGSSITLGKPSARLGHDELARIGVVHQESRFLDWMTVEQQIRYVAAFYPRWDRSRESALRRDLELEGDATVGTLSPGNTQKLAIVLAVCHHPELLVLDEPVSALDPIARGRFLAFLLDEILQDDDATVIVSSHVLRDVEQVVDRILCLEAGRVAADETLDELLERYSEWQVVSVGDLPARFDEPYVRRQEIAAGQASLLVRRTPDSEPPEAFGARHGVEVVSRPLNLERLFPLLVEGEPS